MIDKKRIMAYTVLLFVILTGALSAQDFYWENPVDITLENGWFPVTVSNSKEGAVFWQEYTDVTEDTAEVWFVIVYTDDGISFTPARRVIGPFKVTGDKIPMISAVMNRSGDIYAAVSTSGKGISVYQSTDKGNSFTVAGSTGGGGSNVPTVAPKLFITERDRFILFATQPLAGTSTSVTSDVLGITYSTSFSGRSWSAFKPLVVSQGLSNIYLPHAVSSGNREYVVFQASPTESRFYQLYVTESSDGGNTWSSPVRVTNFNEEGQPADNFDNQRAYLSVHNDSVYITWERHLGLGSAQPYFGRLDTADKTIKDISKIAGTNISSNPVNNPQISFVNGIPVALWYNNIGRIVMAEKRGDIWVNIPLKEQSTGRINSFGRMLNSNNEINVVWQTSKNSKSDVVMLSPDTTVNSPLVYAKNFRPGRANKQDLFEITWNLPQDSSGISAFSYSIDRNPKGSALSRPMVKRRDPRKASVTVNEDGTWYFHVRALDYAGNWSEPSTLSFIRDTTPPAAVKFIPPDTDGNGFLPSNTGEVSWKPPEGEKISGYSYRVQYLSSYDFTGDITAFRIGEPPDVPTTKTPSYRFTNKDNGLWAISVSTFDAVGNKSSSSVLYFRLNKYIPVTYITQVKAFQDDLGNISIDLYGRGFRVGGVITSIILDKDRRAPYDYVYKTGENPFVVKTDRIITGLSIDDMEEGTYYVGLIHPARGLYFNKTELSFESTGAVKFGNFSILEERTGSSVVLERLFTLSANMIAVIVIMLFLLVMFAGASLRIVALVKEGNKLNEEAKALIYNTDLPFERRKEKMKSLKKRGMGIRIKFALWITTLVLIIVLMVAYPLSLFMIKTQQKNLTESLNQTTKVLISSIKTSAAKYLQENNTLELKRLPAQIESMTAATFLTITGPGVEDKDGRINDYIWVTNDTGIENKVDKKDPDVSADPALLPGGDKFAEGRIYMNDPVSARIKPLSAEIDKKGREEVGKLTEELTKLQAEAAKATRFARTEADIEAIRRMQDEILLLSTTIEKKLSEISDVFSSIPSFDPEKILTAPPDYTFYTPIVYQSKGDDTSYFKGAVRLGISSSAIKEEITKSRALLMKRTIYIALLAIGLGIVGALILATIIIIPLNHLLKKVKEISSTDDHLNLKGFKVEVKTRDEILDLAEAVTSMAHGLYVAAEAQKELTVGKEIQKRFIPLEVGKDGSKLSTGAKSTQYADFFGYYEGAKGVSGDYFDFIEIDPDYFAVIKCDIAGKGVSASLIMVEVATIFHNYFNEWKKAEQRRKVISVQKKVTYRIKKPDIAELVYSINSLVEEMGFKGRFAALIVALIETKTGKTFFCNAGDNQVHMYRNSIRKMETITLPEAPACGVFPNDLVEMQSGFKSIPYQLDKGDLLLLFTDGVEEAQRFFRDSNFNKIKCEEPGLKEGELHDTHPLGNENEELGIPRIKEIVNAVLSGGQYNLNKYHNPVADELLAFDFSTCEGRVDEAVLAMVSVEKIFRIYPDPAAGPMDRIQVDVKINDFLKEHFLQYSRYFKHPLKSEEGSLYITFTHMKEDSQYDDLTVLGIKRK
ncbi:MAG: serine/threonine protein phosphatase [Spirochaetes bacterium]|nr:MAG: serine/threonine protein phosphatase [Spirochaetota bacterium]